MFFRIMLKSNVYPIIAIIGSFSWSIALSAQTGSLSLTDLDLSVIELTGHVDSRVEKFCSDYLKSKGFEEDISFRSFTHWRIDDRTYAFTTPTRRKIFMSSDMVRSITFNLLAQKPVSIFDRFTLLHELGHLYPLYPHVRDHECPYGRDYYDLQIKSDIYKREYYDLQSRTDSFSVGGLLGIYLVLVGTLVARETGIIDNEVIQECFAPLFIASLGSIGVSSCIYSIKMLAIQRAMSICSSKMLAIEQAIKQRFKKLAFTHADKEYETYIKNACEEQDADSFALALLSTDELQEFYAHCSSLNGQPSIEDEDGYHQTAQELCLAIMAELEKRMV